MSKALAQRIPHEEAIPSGAHPEGTSSGGASEIALRLALEEARQIAAQSRLLALNAAFESADACREAGAADEMDALGGSAGRAAAEAARISAAVELLLQQIQSASFQSGPL